MEQIFSKLNFITNGEGFTDITDDLNLFIQKSNFDSGIFCLTSLHTSCSLTINENADPNVLKDLEKFIKSIVPYNCYTSLSKEREKIYYEHFQEGEDDMPAHIKTALTNTQLTLSVRSNQCILGAWQGIYLFEHRLNQQNRTILAHIVGD